MSEIIWKDIAGYEGCYQVSNTGLVKSVGRQASVKVNRMNAKGNFFVKERVLKPRPNKKGYFKVAIYNNAHQRRDFSIHTLVLNTFVGVRPNDEYQCRHIDGNNQNNHLDNLAWGTPKENGHDKVIHGTAVVKEMRGEESRYKKLNDEKVLSIRKAIKNKSTLVSLAKMHNVSTACIFKVINNQTWTHL